MHIQKLTKAFRPLQMYTQRPSILNSFYSTGTMEASSSFDMYMDIFHILYGPNSVDKIICPQSNQILPLIARLNQFGSQDVITLETWLLFLPICIEHTPCETCMISLDETGPPVLRKLCNTVLHAAQELVASVHLLVTSDEVFVPPLIACSRAFIAGCVLISGIKGGWQGIEKVPQDLLKCSEVLLFCSSLWDGGRDYYEAWQNIITAL